MELTLRRQPVIINEKILSTTLEQPVELDATLPDYCPDIMKIASCIITPAISTIDISGDRLIVEGNAVISVCYSDEHGEIFRYDGKIPFEKSMDLKINTNSPIIVSDINVSYVNCRAVSGRRLDVRGALNIPLEISDYREEMVLSEIEDDHIQIKPINCNVNRTTGQCQKQFTLREDLDLTYGKEPVKRILRYNCTPVVTDYKLLPGKVVVKGELYITIVYICENTSLPMQSVNYTLPFSQIIDCQHIDENCKCDINLRLCSCIIDAITDDSGTASRFSMQATICGEMTGFKEQPITAIEDCYSTKVSCINKTKNIPVSEEAVMINEDVHIKETIDLPEGTIQICDLWCKSTSCTSTCDGELCANCKIVLGMSVMAPELQYLERTISALVPLNMLCSATMPDAVLKLCIKKLSYSEITSNQCDIHMDCTIKGYATIRSFITAVDAIEVEPLAIPAILNTSMIVYYPYKEEPIWDIAKKFGTSMYNIKSENNIDTDYAKQGDILIITP